MQPVPNAGKQVIITERGKCATGAKRGKTSNHRENMQPVSSAGKQVIITERGGNKKLFLSAEKMQLVPNVVKQVITAEAGKTSSYS